MTLDASWDWSQGGSGLPGGEHHLPLDRTTISPLDRATTSPQESKVIDLPPPPSHRKQRLLTYHHLPPREVKVIDLPPPPPPHPPQHPGTIRRRNAFLFVVFCWGSVRPLIVRHLCLWPRCYVTSCLRSQIGEREKSGRMV